MGNAPQSDKPRVSLVLTGGQAQKKKWEQAIEERYGTMAELVRTSVEREIDGHHDTPETPETTQDSEQVGEVLNIVRQMQATLEEMDRRIEHLERRRESEGPEYDLQTAVFNMLPTPPEGDAHGPKDEYVEVEEYAEWAATVPEIARKLGAEEEAVEDALEDLSEGTGQVKSKEVRGVSGGPYNDTYYFRVGGPE